MSQTVTDIHESKVKWVTLSEASQLLRRCRQTVVKLIEEGEIYGTNKGGRWLIERASIDSYLYEDKRLVEDFKRTV